MPGFCKFLWAVIKKKLKYFECLNYKYNDFLRNYENNQRFYFYRLIYISLCKAISVSINCVCKLNNY